MRPATTNQPAPVAGAHVNPYVGLNRPERMVKPQLCDFVLFVDCYDTVLTGTHEEIVEKLLALEERTGKSIFFGAETQPDHYTQAQQEPGCPEAQTFWAPMFIYAISHDVRIRVVFGFWELRLWPEPTM